MLTLDQTINHQIQLERYKNSVSKDLAIRIQELAKKTNSILASIDDTKASIRKALVEVNKLIDDTFDSIELDILEELKDWLLAEITWVAKNEEVNITEEDRNAFIAVILASLVRGNTLGQWLRGIRNNVKIQVRTNVLNGVNDKLNLMQILRTIRGSSSRRFKDGIWSKISNHLDSISNTAIQAYSNQAKMEIWQEASAKKYIWLSVLDSRTSHICRGRSNKIYVVGDGPTPPAHPRCRSSIMLYTKGMDIPQSYSEWLRKQPREDVEDILGKGKANLFLSNKITLDKFTKPSGRELTLKELKAKLNN